MNNEGQVFANLDRHLSTKEGDKAICRRCGEDYDVPVWHFHGLCDPCFGLFDSAKGDPRYRFSADEWIRDHPFIREDM